MAWKGKPGSIPYVEASTVRERKATYGFRPFPKEGCIVSNDLINKLREDGEY